ncbi:MAG: hypothetical protein ACI4HQ_01405 [Acetatifactor sp.]
MERLTARNDNGTPYYPYCDKVKGCGGFCADCNFEMKSMEKLATYEDAEGNGLLLMLPCKVGDKIYRFWYADDKPYKVQEQEIKTLSNLVAIMESGEIGKTVFLTREEAEQALAEMQGK